VTRTVFGLPVLERELWDDGSVVIWLASPFPYAKKPAIPSRLIDRAKRTTVPLEGLWGTQRRVTSVGVNRYVTSSPDPPLVYRMSDGRMLIADGHHRLTAALLRGDRKAVVRLVETPQKPAA